MTDAVGRPPILRWLSLAVAICATGALVGVEEPPPWFVLAAGVAALVLLAAGTVRAFALGTPSPRRVLEAGLRVAVWPALYLLLGWFTTIELDSWIVLALVPVGLLNAVEALRGSVRIPVPASATGGARSALSGGLVGLAVLAAVGGYHGRFHATATDEERAGQAAEEAPAVSHPAARTLDLGPGVVAKGAWRNVDVRLRATLEPGAIAQVRLRASNVDWAFGVSFFLSTDERFPSGFREESKIDFVPLGEAAPVVPASRPVTVEIAARGREFTAAIDGAVVARAETRRYASGGVVIQTVKGKAVVEGVEIRPVALDEAPVTRTPDVVRGAAALLAFLVGFALLAAWLVRLSPVRTFEVAAFGVAPYAIFLATAAPTGVVDGVRLVAHVALSALLLILLPCIHRERLDGRRYAVLLLAVSIGAALGYRAATRRAWPAEFEQENLLSVVDWSGKRLEPDLIHFQHPALRRWNGYLGDHRLRLVGHAREPAPGTVRVACAGTASTHGYWLKIPYPYRLQLLLQQRKVPAEVIVAAIPSSTAARLYGFVRNVILEYEPDVLTLSLYSADVDALTRFDEMAYLDRITAEGARTTWFDRLRDRIVMRYGQSMLWESIKEFEERRDARRRPPELDAVTRFEAVLERYADLCEERGVSLVLIMEPVAGGQNRLWKHAFYDAMMRVGERRGVRVVNPTPYLNKEGGEELFMDELHPLEVGAQKMAEAILPGVNQTIAERRED